MGQIGKFGSLVFETSSKKILTFNDMQRKVSARWTTHEIFGKKPRSEYMGSDLDEISLNVIFSAAHGVKPRESIEKLEKIVRYGKLANLVIGGKKVGTSKFYIESMSEDWNYILNDGKLMQASVTLNFKEYK